MAAVIQFDIITGDVAANQQKAEKYLREAAQKGAKVALLPELWNCGYRLSDLPRLAETLQGPTVKLLQKLAAELDMFIVGGSIAEKKDDKYYNTSVAINEKGELIQKYRKIHLFRLGLCEHEYFTAGDKWAFTEIAGIKVGMSICFDIRFPELSRNLALRGARIITVPSQWPKIREHEWRILCQARAVENQCFVLATNNTGRFDDLDMEFPGASMIISPFGEILADGNGVEGVYLADMDLELLSKAARIDVFTERRRILDEIDDNML